MNFCGKVGVRGGDSVRDPRSSRSAGRYAAYDRGGPKMAGGGGHAPTFLIADRSQVLERGGRASVRWHGRAGWHGRSSGQGYGDPIVLSDL